MRHVSVIFLITVFLFSGWSIDESWGQVSETEPEGWTTIALDLMDLEIPGEGSGDEMELPPIQGEESREAEPAPSTDQQSTPEVERSMGEFPEMSRSVPPASPGVVPFLLEEPGFESEATRRGTEPPIERAPATLAEELPAELKTVPPPSSLAETLKLHSGADMGAPGRSDAPEIPLLKGEVQGQQVPLGQDSSLTMKPFPDLSGTQSAGPSARPYQPGPRPEDYLQVREDIDARLIDLYERYYKDR